MKKKILLFGGTTEGRLLAESLSAAGVEHVVSVATEYGKRVEEESGETHLAVGRKDCREVGEMLSSGEFAAVVDATHPFAREVKDQLRAACQQANVPYIRIARRTETSALRESAAGEIIPADTAAEAAELLEKMPGNILLLTGSRDLKVITERVYDKARLYVRVLPDRESLAKCEEAGFSGRQIIAMQGPFSVQMNMALMKEVGASVILTKESGREGGFPEKLEAAQRLGIKTVVIKNPEGGAGEESLDLQSAMRYISSLLELPERVTLAGIGPGGKKYFTRELSEALSGADIVFGASTVIDFLMAAEERGSDRHPYIRTYDAEEILAYLEEHREYTNPLIAFSGDISLCSGAKKAAAFFQNAGFRIRKIAGISSLTLFAGKLGIALEDARVLSAHGRSCDVTALVRTTEHLFVLPSDAAGAEAIYGELKKNGLLGTGQDERRQGVLVTAGVNLGSDREMLCRITRPGELREFFGRVILYIHNPLAASPEPMATDGRTEAAG